MLQKASPAAPARKAPHPVVYSVLYFPFGALGGFVTVALTFLGTKHGLSITESAFLGAAQLFISYLKWSWAPFVDITLNPKKWYWIAVSTSAMAALALSIVPLSVETLPLMVGIVAAGAVVNSVVGMSVESLMAAATPTEQQGKVGGWFQVGNLGGNGVGGGLGLILLERLEQPWIAGAILGGSFLLCGTALRFLPDVEAHRREGGFGAALRGVAVDIKDLARSKGGLLTAILCFLPVGTGAASGVLTQAAVAKQWSAGADQVAILQGVLAGVIMAFGCVAGGYICDRIHPRIAYAVFGLVLAGLAVGMAVSPMTIAMFIGWSMVYNFSVGLAYTAFTATVLNAMGQGSAATKYNLYASLSNFPIWWLGLLLAWVADNHGPTEMLWTEAGLGVLGVGVFVVATRVVGNSKLPA